MTLLPWDDPRIQRALGHADRKPTVFDGPDTDFLSRLPKAPPTRSTNPFAKENRSDTLLAIGSGMMRGGNFGESLANAADTILSRRQDLRKANVRQSTLGGPDDAFEITVDPETGERSYTPVQAFQNYLEEQKASKNQPKADDVIKQRGAVMGSILQAPKEQRATLYERVVSDPQFAALGLPPTWDEGIATTYRDRAISPADQLKIDILRQRAEDSRIDDERDYQIQSQKLNAPPSTRRSRINPNNADLSYLLGQ
ncbi:hypothetical protein BSL82_03695 [Tardibacter chloracetimidivorans]|uniref:Uncharacterized protein n=2 Tax=Tardibacter chloracetimidivorans TaxID=1921510 RepID=A0A1L3ZSC9_9SPHN|nr:hypothetical protein BSL82_03695 [Tardibacter chloracetimidivorans]